MPYDGAARIGDSERVVGGAYAAGARRVPCTAHRTCDELRERGNDRRAVRSSVTTLRR